MAPLVVSHSPSVMDSSGFTRERSSQVLDLSRLDALLHASSHVQKTLKGKNVSSSVIVPLSVPEISVATPDHLQARVPETKPNELGVSVTKQNDLGVSTTVKTQVLSSSGTSSNASSWTNIVQNKVVQPLEFVEPIYAGNVIKIPSHLLDIGRKKYSLCLVGQFMGLAPKLGLIQAMAMKLWGRQGPLRRVPFELLTTDGLSYLTSAIGKPSHMNQDCSKLMSSDRVNVCVEVDYSKPLLDQLDVEFDGCTRTIDVSYSWKPQFCDICRQWGHHSIACSLKKASIQWVPKPKPVVSQSVAEVPTAVNKPTCMTSNHLQVAIPPLVASDPLPVNTDRFDVEVPAAANKATCMIVSQSQVPILSDADCSAVSVGSGNPPVADLEALMTSNVSNSVGVQLNSLLMLLM
ncbi:hypothetical protein Tsubulata_039006 [Turnera subulata]|uniref:DUF4283 domain-containing protein n=1 Tax=Turnera subulata TaxID=218843 RepID=A0A9Q0J0B1_9ROSI|nr:hypothetical protein Tsubulata_039006 [Turnera subulata]